MGSAPFCRPHWTPAAPLWDEAGPHLLYPSRLRNWGGALCVVGSHRTRQSWAEETGYPAPSEHNTWELERFGGALCCSGGGEWEKGKGPGCPTWFLLQFHRASFAIFYSRRGWEQKRVGRPVLATATQLHQRKPRKAFSFLSGCPAFLHAAGWLLSRVTLPPSSPPAPFLLQGQGGGQEAPAASNRTPCSKPLWLRLIPPPLQKPREAVSSWKNPAGAKPSHRLGAVSASEKFPLRAF